MTGSLITTSTFGMEEMLLLNLRNQIVVFIFMIITSNVQEMPVYNSITSSHFNIAFIWWRKCQFEISKHQSWLYNHYILHSI
jgi:hypothetical protein